MSPKPPSQHYTGPILGSVLLHSVIIAALVTHVDWGDHDKEVVMANVIDAEVVQPGALEAVDEAKAQQRREREQARRKELERQREAERQKALQAQREQKAQAEAERKAAEREAERQRQLALQAAEEKERLEQQRQAEEERRRKQEQLEAERERRRQEMLAEEQRLLEQAQQAEWERLQEAEEQAQAQARSRELADKMALYRDAIKQRVNRNWIRPGSAEDRYTCEVTVDQIPGGEIVNVRFNACDGDAVFQRSVRNAVYKSSPLPSPPDPALFERRITFTFRVPDE